MNTILFIQFTSCVFLTGLIWTIQLVHYPSFLWVDKERFRAFESFHTRRITFLVLPLMSLELVSALGLFYFAPFRWLNSINFILLILIWLVTLLVSSPLHGQLLKAYSEDKIKRLISTNWIRTVLWTTRSSLWVYYLVNAER